MRLFVIIATIVACISAAPTAELQHPSPVNPNVLVEIKPEEKIVLITDPKELAKFKRETKQPLYPTVLPGYQVHHITKREVTQKPEEVQKPQLLPVILPVEVITEKYTEPKSNQQIEVPNTNNDNKKSQQDQEKDEKNVTTEVVYQKPQGLPAIFSPSNKAIQQQKRDIPVPLVAKHQHPEESPKEPNEKETQNEKHDDQKVSEVFQKPQGLPAIFSPANVALQPQKRDIPVPLVPKYHHPEESPKELDEKDNQENKKELDSDKKHEAQTLPALKEDHVRAEGFQKPQPLPLNLKDNHEDTQHKRDIPVPLVPKYHHPEESPKEIDENKKEIKSESQHVPQILPAHNQDHITEDGFQKPQQLPLILKDNHDDTQHKRDIPVPLVPKYHHPEESPKDSNEKEDHEEKKEVETENHHEPQIVHANNHEDHVAKVGLEKTQLPLILKENPEETQHKRDIPVPLVPKYHHLEESSKDVKEKEDHEDKKEVKIENHNVPQTLPAHNQDHITAENFQKPQILPLIFKETSDDSKQNKRDIPVPLVPKHQHPEESPKENNNEKESHEDKKEVKLENSQSAQTIVTKEETPKDTSNEKKPQEESSKQHHVPQIHHVTQALPNYHHEHVNFDAIHRPQVLPALNHEHSSTPSFQNPQFLIKHQEHNIQKDEEKSESNANPHHISQTLPGHIHKHLAAEGLQKPQFLPSHNQEHAISTAGLIHLPTHFQTDNLKKPQTLPVPLQQKSDNSETVIGHQHEETKNDDHHPNKHEVQVEDLSESKPFQQPIHHNQPSFGDHKPNILDDHISARDFTTSTTTTVPTILRHRPVPVAELFARAHGN